MVDSIDEKLVHLRLPMAAGELCRLLDELTDNCDAYDFVADRGARKARECWIASRFLTAHSKQTGRQYEVTRLVTDTPDIEYRNITQPRTLLSVEAAELVNPHEKRNEKWLQRKRQREASEWTGEAYQPPLEFIPHEAIEAERRVFCELASTVLGQKLRRDYGPNCTLVLYVNLGLFGEEPIRKVAAAYKLPPSVQFREIWFLYSADTIIPLLSHQVGPP